jgi:hypothetical protein
MIDSVSVSIGTSDVGGYGTVCLHTCPCLSLERVYLCVSLQRANTIFRPGTKTETTILLNKCKSKSPKKTRFPQSVVHSSHTMNTIIHFIMNQENEI